MVGAAGIEPATSSVSTRCSTTKLYAPSEPRGSPNQRVRGSRDTLQLKAQAGFEPAYCCFADSCLTTWLLRQQKSGRRVSNPRPTAWEAVALPTELLPQPAYGGKIQNPNYKIQTKTTTFGFGQFIINGIGCQLTGAKALSAFLSSAWLFCRCVIPGIRRGRSRRLFP